jgi:hypothetical protein
MKDKLIAVSLLLLLITVSAGIGEAIFECCLYVDPLEVLRDMEKLR